MEPQRLELSILLGETEQEHEAREAEARARPEPEEEPSHPWAAEESLHDRSGEWKGWRSGWRGWTP
jgi:hypothetical protein